MLIRIRWKALRYQKPTIKKKVESITEMLANIDLKDGKTDKKTFVTPSPPPKKELEVSDTVLAWGSDSNQPLMTDIESLLKKRQDIATKDKQSHNEKISKSNNKQTIVEETTKSPKDVCDEKDKSDDRQEHLDAKQGAFASFYIEFDEEPQKIVIEEKELVKKYKNEIDNAYQNEEWKGIHIDAIFTVNYSNFATKVKNLNRT